MGLFDAVGDVLGLNRQELFGGQTQSSAPWKAQQPYLQTMFGEAQRLYQNQSPYINQAQQMMAQRAQRGSPLLAAGQEGLMSTIQGDYLPGGARYNPMTEAIRREVMPSIDTRFGRAGRFGSGLHKIGLGQAITDRLAQGMEAERGRQFGAYEMAPQMAAADYGDINQLYQAGMIPWQQLQAFQQGLGPTIGTSTGQSTTGLLPSLGSIGQGAGNLAAAAYLMSDRRVKRNLREIGKIKDIPVYIFNYLWSDTDHIGVMAQDVEKVYPEAVKEFNGIKAVNYACLF